MRRVFFQFKILCCFLLCLGIPCNVFAGETLKKEQKFVTSKKEKTDWKPYTDFPISYEEGGKLYQLKGIQYEILEKKLLDTVEKVVISESPEEQFQEGEISFFLVRKGEAKRGEVQKVTSFIDYDYQVSESQVPITKTVRVFNEETKQEEEVVCSLIGIARNGTEIVSNQISITYIGYDAISYNWNGFVIPRNEAYPAIGDYQEALLQSVGAEEGSRITSIAWAGGEYEVDGVIYRDAIANVEQQRTIYRVWYEGVASQRKAFEAIYKGKDPKGAAQYTVKAIATYDVIKKPSILTKTVAIGVGTVLFLGLILAILFLLKKKSEKKMEVM